MSVVRLISALDSRRGISTERGIPWHLPGDVAHFRASTRSGVVLMGRATYEEFAAPLHERVNLVLTRSTSPLRKGFQSVPDLSRAISAHPDTDLWVIGGAAVFALAIDRADELVLTQVDGDFGCTKFFPAFEDRYRRVDSSDAQEENDITYRFETWRHDGA